MGILNVTPDSFSDGGDRLDPGRAIAAGQVMAAEGATILDIGGESTRPGASPLDPAEEQRRVLPVIAGLARLGVQLSADTRNASTMERALDAGAGIVNDVSALMHDPLAPRLLARLRCPVVLMHMRGTPATMRALARYDDVAAEVRDELAERVRGAEQAGIERARIAIDPGIGFAKDAAQNLELLRRLPVLAGLGLPLVVGASRKAFIGHAAAQPDPKARGPGSLAAALFAVSRGASVVRVHDVKETVQALRVWRALAGGAAGRQGESGEN